MINETCSATPLDAVLIEPRPSGILSDVWLRKNIQKDVADNGIDSGNAIEFYRADEIHFVQAGVPTIDGITAAMLASTLGLGVIFSAVAVFVYQGAITLLAGLLQPLLTEAIITEMSAVGGLLIFAIGLNMQGITKIRVGNLLPAILVPLAYIPIYNWIMAMIK